MRIAAPYRPAPSPPESWPLIVRPLTPFSDEQYYECRRLNDLQITWRPSWGYLPGSSYLRGRNGSTGSERARDTTV